MRNLSWKSIQQIEAWELSQMLYIKHFECLLDTNITLLHHKVPFSFCEGYFLPLQLGFVLVDYYFFSIVLPIKMMLLEKKRAVRKFLPQVIYYVENYVISTTFSIL